MRGEREFRAREGALREQIYNFSLASFKYLFRFPISRRRVLLCDRTALRIKIMLIGAENL